jgi:hypothetical protein
MPLGSEQDEAAFKMLRARLQQAFAAPDEDYVRVSAADVIARAKARRAKR